MRMNQTATSGSHNLIELTAEVISAYVTQNSVPTAQLPDLIAVVHGALKMLGQQPAEPTSQELRPAVPIKTSITPDFLVCLEDGRRFKSLRRHLSSKYGMTPDQYRAKWSLPKDYPMVAPNYAAARSEFARRMGLGQIRRKKAPVTPKTSKGSRNRSSGRGKSTASSHVR